MCYAQWGKTNCKCNLHRIKNMKGKNYGEKKWTTEKWFNNGSNNIPLHRNTDTERKSARTHTHTYKSRVHFWVHVDIGKEC